MALPLTQVKSILIITYFIYFLAIFIISHFVIPWLDHGIQFF
ncbi:putative membrane protein [Rickettsia amblyommatis str. Ac/Pa]|uniref:Putative membrane protein n=1 Tax=Rickettsia amblyommatis str. Ac/Pa TaxID=1359164 RepID=A0A0F3N1Y4_RICAM|nr:putative membrane protein [Rickettsia amblyommatis str. Ac/Pa]